MDHLRWQWLAAAVLVLGSNAVAAGVSASVSLTCAITTTPVSFSAYEVLPRSATETTGAVMITSTQGAIYDIALDAGTQPLIPGNSATRRMKPVELDHSLPYALFIDTARFTLWGNQFNSIPRLVTHIGNGMAHNYPVYGRIAAGQFVPAGLYADTVITPLMYQ